MQTNESRMLLWTMVLAMALASCSAGAGEVIRDEPKPSIGALEATEAEARYAPLQLELEGNPRPDGDLDLVATLRVAARLVAPPVLRILLPGGAILLRGYAEEVLAAPGRDVVYRRTFRVTPGSAAVRVVAQSIGVGYGTRVEAEWPAPGTLQPVPSVTSP